MQPVLQHLAETRQVCIVWSGTEFQLRQKVAQTNKACDQTVQLVWHGIVCCRNTSAGSAHTSEACGKQLSTQHTLIIEVFKVAALTPDTREGRRAVAQEDAPGPAWPVAAITHAL